MRIGLFTDTYSPDINGVATSVLILEEELIKHGHEVFVITSSNSKVIVHENNLIKMPGFSFKKLYGYKISNFYSSVGSEYIKRLQLDLIHTHTEYGIGVFGRIVASKYKIPLVYTYHTMMEDYTHYITDFTKGLFETQVKTMFMKSSKLFANHCSELIVPSKKTYDAMLRYGVTNHINIIPTGINLDSFQSFLFSEQLIEETKALYNITNEDFLCIYLGRVAPEKSIEFIIEAFTKLKDNSHLKLMIVGDGPSFDEIKDLIVAHQIDSQVILTGKIDRTLVPLYYQLADVFISTSQSETQGLTFIEAMASHLPIIARYDENLCDVIDDGSNGYFVNTVEELSDLIKKISIMEFDEYISLCNNAKEKTSEFSSRIFYEKVMNVYDKAVRNSRTSKKKGFKINQR